MSIRWCRISWASQSAEKRFVSGGGGGLPKSRPFIPKIETLKRMHSVYVYKLHIDLNKVFPGINPFPHTAILQQTTFRKILNVHSSERNEHFLSWKALKTLWLCHNIFKCRLLQTSIYGVKG